MFYKVCIRYTKNEEEAEQVLNDGYLKIFNKINDYKGKGSFEGWMRKIIVNTCLDVIKGKDFKKNEKVNYSEKIEDTLSIDHYTVLSKLAFQDLVKLIHELPDNTKTVFNLFVFEGFTHKEISKIIGINEGTSQWHMNNARKLLQQSIHTMAEKNYNYDFKK